MPDGSIAQRTEFDAACVRMDRRLVQWGIVRLQGSKRPSELVQADENGEPAEKDYITPDDELKAAAVETLVNLLPATPRFVLRVFYRGREAQDWATIMPDKRLVVLDDMCREFNSRMDEYCTTAGLPKPMRVHGYHFGPMREAAVRACVVAEASLPRPKSLPPCG